MTTYLDVCNWTGIDIYVDVSHAIFTDNVKIPPATDQYYRKQIVFSDLKYTNTRIDVRVMQGATNDSNGDTVTYMVPVDGMGRAAMFFVSNTGFPSVKNMVENKNDAYNAYTYTYGFQRDRCYIVSGDFYSPANNWGFDSSMFAIEMPGSSYTGRQLVYNAFAPTLTGPQNPPGEPDGRPPVVDPCQSCTVCDDCPDCPQCPTKTAEVEEDGSSWYWWVLAVVLVIAVLGLLLAGGFWFWKKRQHSGEMVDGESTASDGELP